MGELGKIHQLVIPFLGHEIRLNLEVILMTWIVFVLLIIFGIATSRKRALLPRPMQVLGELFIEQFYHLTEDALDKEMAKKYGPLVCALFMFLVLVQLAGDHSPSGRTDQGSEHPLESWAHGLCHCPLCRYQVQRIKAYAKEYFEPMFFMMPLNVIGELAKIVSISFRLVWKHHGWIDHHSGGFISDLQRDSAAVSECFFRSFCRTIQAFVFTMLTLSNFSTGKINYGY